LTVTDGTTTKGKVAQLAEKKAKSGHGGPRPNSGGARPRAGRPKGVQNKVTIELGEAARAYTTEALATLHLICVSGESEPARIAAACALLDRGHGKPKQQQEVKLDGSDMFLRCWTSISDGTAA
jgi:hypothetical protein